MASTLINTREDFDAIAGTPEHDEFMEFLKGTTTRMENQAVYPEGYGQPGYSGAEISPVWVAVEDLSTITRFGFIKADFVK